LDKGKGGSKKSVLGRMSLKNDPLRTSCQDRKYSFAEIRYGMAVNRLKTGSIALQKFSVD